MSFGIIYHFKPTIKKKRLLSTQSVVSYIKYRYQFEGYLDKLVEYIEKTVEIKYFYWYRFLQHKHQRQTKDNHKRSEPILSPLVVESIKVERHQLRHL